MEKSEAHPFPFRVVLATPGLRSSVYLLNVYGLIFYLSPISVLQLSVNSGLILFNVELSSLDNHFIKSQS